MSELGGYSSIPLAEQKPVIVRVKRKATHSKLEAFWLEISDRPVKRPLVDFKNLSVSEPPAKAGVEISEKLPHLDFGKLSFSDSSPNGKPEKRTVFVQHVKTVTSSEATCDILKSLVGFTQQSSSVGSSEKRVKIGRDRNILKGESKQDQRLSKAKHEQEMSAKNARFEQIWRSRKSKKELMQEEPLRVTCHLYDIERVDVQETTKDVHESSSSDVFFEEYAVLQNYLSLMDEFLPSAAEELRSDMQSYASGLKDEYVYDLYTVNADVDMNDTEVIQPYPLVHVDEDDTFYDGPDESDYDSADSNAEDNPLNDYPEEEPFEEEDAETESADSNVESDQDDSDKSSTESLKPEDLLFFGNGRAVNVEEDDNILDYDDSIEEDNDYELDEDDLDDH